mmetsp:Transcript_11266/g.22691  ORF Transcript_11266/g.22691 Transcript_11266/m.22691 type:complete len:93 (-) Transcript_11266:6808-7086(-)
MYRPHNDHPSLVEMTMSIVVVPSFILLNPLHGQTTETEHEMETFQLIDGGEENAYRSSAWKGTISGVMTPEGGYGSTPFPLGLAPPGHPVLT